jgi:hypothetical protein
MLLLLSENDHRKSGDWLKRSGRCEMHLVYRRVQDTRTAKRCDRKHFGNLIKLEVLRIRDRD